MAQDRIPWITDLREARQAAEQQNRLVLLHFWTETCLPCKRLESSVFNQPEFIRALTTGYVPVKINANEQPNLAKFYNIERVPTDVIVTPQGREVYRAASPADSNQYITMLDGVRANSSVSNYAPIANGATGRDLGSRTGSESGYGRAWNNQSVEEPAVQEPPARPAPTVVENRYVNPLESPAPRQETTVASRYANPYAEQAPPSPDNHASQYGGGSRYGDNGAPTSDPRSAANSQNPGYAPQQAHPRDNWQQDRVANAQPSRYSNPAQSNTHYDHPVTRPEPQSPSPADVAAPPAANPNPAAGQPQFALDGYCPVALVEQRAWVLGDRKWGAVHDERVYLFSSPEAQHKFLANPEVFAPLWAGYDFVRYAESGQLVPGRREFGLYIDEPGPIALFADEAALVRFHANSGYYLNLVRQAKQQRAGQTTR